MAHRIRWAMTQEPLASKLEGIVEVDETYVGSRTDGSGRRFKGSVRKTPVVTLVERGGRARSFVPLDVNGTNIDRILRQNVSRKAEIHPDEARWYTEPGKRFRDHQTVNHKRKGYARDVVTRTPWRAFSAFSSGGLSGRSITSPRTTFTAISPSSISATTFVRSRTASVRLSRRRLRRGSDSFSGRLNNEGPGFPGPDSPNRQAGPSKVLTV